MKHKTGNLWIHLRSGASAVVVTWLWYAIFEAVVADLMSVFTSANDPFAIWHWVLTAALTLIYLAVGVVSGALVAAVLHATVRAWVEQGEDLSSDIQRVVPLMAASVYAASLLVTYGFVATAITLMSVLTILGAAVVAAAGPDRRRAVLRGSTLAWSAPRGWSWNC